MFFATASVAFRLLLWLQLHLHIKYNPLSASLVKAQPVHEHPAATREVGAGEEVALAPADVEEVAHFELIALVEVKERVIDAWAALKTV